MFCQRFCGYFFNLIFGSFGFNLEFINCKLLKSNKSRIGLFDIIYLLDSSARFWKRNVRIDYFLVTA